MTRRTALMPLVLLPPLCVPRSAKVWNAVGLEQRLSMDTTQLLSLIALPVLLLLLYRAERTITSLRKQVAQLQLQLAIRNAEQQ